ncbi:MAG: hypothetical protein WCY04_02075, partial [Bacilli bacterium]
MTDCSFKGTVKADNKTAGGLFANSDSGGWLTPTTVVDGLPTIGLGDLLDKNIDGLVIHSNSVEGDITSPIRPARFFSNTSGDINVVSYELISSAVYGNTFTGHVYAGSPLLDVTVSFTENTN